jgi:hypothetical protein
MTANDGNFSVWVNGKSRSKNQPKSSDRRGGVVQGGFAQQPAD